MGISGHKKAGDYRLQMPSEMFLGMLSFVLAETKQAPKV